MAVKRKKITKKAIRKKSAGAKSSKKLKTTKKVTSKSGRTKKVNSVKATGTRKKKKQVKKNGPKQSKSRKKAVSKIVARKSTPIIPEVPIRRTSKFSLDSKFKNQKNEVFFDEFTPSVVRESALTKKKKKSSVLILTFLFVALLSLFFINNTNNPKSVDDQKTMSPSNGSSKSTTASALATGKAFKLTFEYTSTGISIDYQSALRLGEIKEFTILSSGNGQMDKIIGKSAATKSKVGVMKIDTIGKTTFKVQALMSDGTQIESTPLKIEGLFDSKIS